MCVWVGGGGGGARLSLKIGTDRPSAANTSVQALKSSYLLSSDQLKVGSRRARATSRLLLQVVAQGRPWGANCLLALTVDTWFARTHSSHSSHALR